jgi:hypothetical protein
MLARAYAKRFKTVVPSGVFKSAAMGVTKPGVAEARIEKALNEGRPDGEWQAQLARLRSGERMLTINDHIDLDNLQRALQDNSPGSVLR